MYLDFLVSRKVRKKMQKFRQNLFNSLFILALLLTACQSIARNSGSLSTEKTTISQAAPPSSTPTDAPTPPAMLIHTSTPLPTPTDSPTSLLTSTPVPSPTPPAIPADEPMPTATNTPAPAPVGAPAPSEVDLVTLEESLVVLDLVERRRVEPTSTPIRPIIYEGAASYVTKSETGDCDCSTCNGVTFTAKVFIDVDGVVLGILQPHKVELTGTRNAITGKRTSGPNNCDAYWTLTLQARLTNNDQILDGILDSTFTPGNCSMDNCGGIWTFSLPRK